MSLSLVHTVFLTKPSHFLSGRSIIFGLQLSSFSTSFAPIPSEKVNACKKWRHPVASLLELGGAKISREEIVKDDPTNNVPDSIFSKLGLQLHRRDQHPLGILKNAIYDYFDTNHPNKFDKFDDLSPLVSVKANFDDVLVPTDHVSRSYNDTYYVDSQTVLRCHTSAHQAQLLREGHTHFLVTGDVYRRDSIDSTHYPVFHQMEGVRVFSPRDWQDSGTDATSYVAEDLKKCLEGLAQHLFGSSELGYSNYSSVLNFRIYIFLIEHVLTRSKTKEAAEESETEDIKKDIQNMYWNQWSNKFKNLTFKGFNEYENIPGKWLDFFHSQCGVEMRWIDAYFPFTNPSFELEIYFQETWLEVLGCGVMELEILKRSGRTDNIAWAFGLGLERLAMVLFDIPDIRLFWTTDQRFTSQFSKGQLGVKFKQFSKYPPCYKDVSFWISDAFTENNLCEIIRGVAGDLVEEVTLIDNFTNKKGMTSHCYRVAYRSMERSLTDEEINDLQWRVREQIEAKLKVVMR